jgi:hypothetical protein
MVRSKKIKLHLLSNLVKIDHEKMHVIVSENK